MDVFEIHDANVVDELSKALIEPEFSALHGLSCLLGIWRLVQQLLDAQEENGREQ